MEVNALPNITQGNHHTIDSDLPAGRFPYSKQLFNKQQSTTFRRVAIPEERRWRYCFHYSRSRKSGSLHVVLSCISDNLRLYFGKLPEIHPGMQQFCQHPERLGETGPGLKKKKF